MSYPEHVQWIIDNRGEVLTKALLQDSSYKTIDNPINIFLDTDPTSKKKLTQWLVDTYIKGGFRWEDIQSGSNSKVFDTLSLYIKHKSKLDSTNHIGQYDTLGSVYKDIAPFIKSDKSSRSVKHDAQTQAYEESEILVKSESLTVVIPKTEYASKWWGKGTQWCTAGDNNNIFERYNKNGPLIIIIINGVKTQMHVDLVNKNRYIQFMDEHDNPLELKLIEDNWSLLSPIIKWCSKYSKSTLCCFPKHLRTPELCLEAVKQSGEFLYHVPQPLRTPELCLEAVKNNGWALGYVPTPLRTAELCLEAVKQNSEALMYVPGDLRTSEICLEAVRQNGEALRFINEDLRTPELCLDAVRHNGEVLRIVNVLLITQELCLEAVRQNGWALGYVPTPLRTAELCLEAVKQNGLALMYVPGDLRTPELCLEAVRKNGGALYYVTEPLKTEKLCLEAIKQYGKALNYVPTPLITAELCLEAVKQNGEALEYVPEYLRTEEILFYIKKDSKKDNEYNKKTWNFNVFEELKLQLNISNALDTNAICVK